MPAKMDAVLVDLGRGVFDIEIDEFGDIRTEDTFETALIVSLFSDARADASEVQDARRRRGWIGDEGTAPPDNTGSKLWIYEQARLTRTIANQVEDAARRALQWLVQDGHAVSVRRAELVISQEAVRFVVEILTEVGAQTRSFVLWEATGEPAPPAGPPMVVPPPPPVVPPTALGVTQSIDFNGTDEVMQRLGASALALGISDRWTLALWIKMTALDPGSDVLVDLGENTTANNQIVMSIIAAPTSFHFLVRDPAANTIYGFNATTIPSAGRWYHLAMSLNPSVADTTQRFQIFVDGANVTATATKIFGTYVAPTDTARRYVLGGARGNVNNTACRIHSLATWDEALTDAEVAAIAAEPDADLRVAFTGYGRQADLVHYHVPGISPGSQAGIENDYGVLGNHDLDGSSLQNITTADVVTDAPG